MVQLVMFLVLALWRIARGIRMRWVHLMRLTQLSAGCRSVIQGKCSARLFARNSLNGGVPTQCWRDQTLEIVCRSRTVRLTLFMLAHGLLEAVTLGWVVILTRENAFDTVCWTECSEQLKL